MRLLVINPNTTASMTRSIGIAAAAAASAGTVVTAVNPDMGPASIEGPYDEALSVPGLLAEVAKGNTNADIGRLLHISEATVKTHLLRAFNKLGVSDRTAAVTTAMSLGLLG